MSAASPIVLSHSLGMRIPAEGPEDAESGRKLRSLGWDLAQGDYLGGPFTVEALERWGTR